MNVPPNDSVIWIYVRMLVLSGIILTFCEFAYHNHLAAADIQMLMTAVGGVIGVDLFKRYTAPGSPSAAPTTPESKE